MAGPPEAFAVVGGFVRPFGPVEGFTLGSADAAAADSVAEAVGS